MERHRCVVCRSQPRRCDRFDCHRDLRRAVSAAIRRVKADIPTYEALHLPKIYHDLIERTNEGMILVVGVTGSGKSTTLAAMIEHINAHSKKHLITLEDPIEYVFEDNQSVIEQREVGLDTLSFHHALVHVLRQDPDIIMIGEMRDSVSFSAAMSAADTGHLVLSTLHTTNAAQSVNRILDFFPAERLRVTCSEHQSHLTPTLWSSGRRKQILDPTPSRAQFSPSPDRNPRGRTLHDQDVLLAE